MNNQPRLKINGIEVPDLVPEGLTIEQSLGNPSTMTARLRLQGEHLKYLDLRGLVSLEVETREGPHRVFTGYVVQGRAGDAVYVLNCIDPMRILEEQRMGGLLGEGLIPGEQIYYLLAETMPDSVDKSLLHTGVGGTVADAEWIFRLRRYMFIAPVPSCRLSAAEVRFAGAVLYTANSQGIADDQVIARGLPKNPPPEWSDGATRIRFYVHAEGFLDAFENGRARLRKLLDFLSFGANLSTPSYSLGDGYRFHDYDRDRVVVDVSETAWAYVRDIVPGRMDRFWLKWFGPHRLERPFTIRENDPLLALYPVFQPLLDADDATLTDAERPLLSAVHNLRRARHAANTLDALHHCWQCVEFLVGGYRPSARFTKQDRKALLKVTRCVLRKRYEGYESEEQKQRLNRVEYLISQLDEPSLMGKWRTFCEEHDLQFSPEDTEFLRKMREVRNYDVHGRLTAVERDDVDRVAGILEKAVIAAVQAARAPR